MAQSAARADRAAARAVAEGPTAKLARTREEAAAAVAVRGERETVLAAEREELVAPVMALEENARVAGRVAAEESRAASEAAGAKAEERGTTLGYVASLSKKC